MSDEHEVLHEVLSNPLIITYIYNHQLRAIILLTQPLQPLIFSPIKSMI